MATLKDYALTNLADVKETLGIPSATTTYDNLIIRKINQATAMIESYCGRRFKLATYTDELYNGNGTNKLVLKQRPIVGSIVLKRRDTSLNEADFDTVDDEIYFSDANSGVINMLANSGGVYGRFAVTYQAGYETIPDDLAEACANLAAYLVENSPSDINVSSKREGQRQVSYSGSITSAENLMQKLGIDETLDSYANISVFADK